MGTEVCVQIHLLLVWHLSCFLHCEVGKVVSDGICCLPVCARCLTMTSRAIVLTLHEGMALILLFYGQGTGSEIIGLMSRSELNLELMHVTHCLLQCTALTRAALELMIRIGARQLVVWKSDPATPWLKDSIFFPVFFFF